MRVEELPLSEPTSARPMRVEELPPDDTSESNATTKPAAKGKKTALVLISLALIVASAVVIGISLQGTSKNSQSASSAAANYTST